MFIIRESRHALGKSEWKRGEEGRKKKKGGRGRRERDGCPFSRFTGNIKSVGRKGRKDEGWERTRGSRKERTRGSLVGRTGTPSGFGH